MTGQAAGAAKIDPASVLIPNDAGYGKVTIEKKDMWIKINFTFEFNVITRRTDHACEAHVYNGVLSYIEFVENEYEDITGTLRWNENNMGEGVMISLEATSNKGKLEIENIQLKFNNIDDNTRKRVGQVTSGQIILKDTSGDSSSPDIKDATISITNY